MQFTIQIGLFALLSTLSVILGPPLRAQEKPKVPVAQPFEDLKKESPPFRGLDAALYMQHSAEYRACCLQTFRLASTLVKAKLDSKSPTSLPRAVVLDLDETVLDNGWFQAEQIRQQQAFDPVRWSQWEKEGADQIRLIPGAKKFIDQLREWKIQPVYITNRNDEARAQTMKALKRLEVEVPEEQLLCANTTTGSNKTSRRGLVESKFEVLLYVGDNLRDFDERFRLGDSGAMGRAQQVDSLEEKFGVDWVILPNPAYGEWNKAFSNTPNDANLLYR